MALTFIYPWVAGSLAASGGGEGGGFSLMQIDPGTILWTLIIFALVVVILGFLVWKPILKAVGEREKRIKDSLDKADRAQADAEAALADQKALVDKQRKEASEFLSQAKEDAQRSGNEIVEKARKEASELTDRARRQIEEEKNRAIDAVRSQAVDLALQAAGHLLGKTLDQESQKAIVRDYIDSLPENLKHH